MPALDFPANPTNGQVYANWIYSSSKGAWQAKPITGPKTVFGTVPPANPALGDEWTNSNDFTTYTWYVDVDGGQWVEKRSQIAKSQVGLVPITPTSIVVGSGTGSADTSGNVTFSASSSTSLNGVFTSSFTNYLILWDITTTVDSVPAFRLRLGGTDTTSGYYAGRIYQIDGSIGGQNNGSGANWGITPTAVQKYEGNMTLYKPNLAVNTHGHHSSFMVSSNSSGTTIAQQHGTQAFLSATQFDGITLYPSTGTMTGSLKVYGYN